MAKKEYPKTPVLPVDIAGKIPPQALDLEDAVLGALMLEKDAILTVIDILKPESFYKDAHQKIFKAILDLATWEAVQAKLDRGRKESTRNARRLYLLRCHIKCQCGYSFTGSNGGRKNEQYYRCTGHNTDSVRKCSMPRVKAELLEGKVWEWIDTDVLNEDHIRAAVADRQDGTAEARARLEAERERYYRQLVDLDTQIDRLAQLFARGADERFYLGTPDCKDPRCPLLSI